MRRIDIEELRPRASWLRLVDSRTAYGSRGRI